MIAGFLLPGSFSVFAEQTEHTFSKVVDRKMNYLLYLPVAYTHQPHADFPLILFLHGGGEVGSDLEKVKKHGPPRLIEEGRDFPFIVVSPQNPENRLWKDSTVIELLNEIEETYRVDSQRIYLTGMSRGGYGAWRMAIQNPNRFAALIQFVAEEIHFMFLALNTCRSGYFTAQRIRSSPSPNHSDWLMHWRPAVAMCSSLSIQKPSTIHGQIPIIIRPCMNGCWIRQTRTVFNFVARQKQINLK